MVSGTVRGVDGIPITDAEVLFHAGNGEKSGEPGFNTITDAHGHYSGRIPPGEKRYGILARKPGFQPTVQTDISVLQDTVIDVIVRPGALVGGHVTAPESPIVGIPGVLVEVIFGADAGRSTTSGPFGFGGNYSMGYVVPGTIALRASKAGYEPVVKTVDATVDVVVDFALSPK